MPLPKGIHDDPAVRSRWIEERRALLERVDRLTGKGLSQRNAAARLHVSPAGIKAMRASLAHLEESGGAKTKQAVKTSRVDLGLALLSILRRPGEALTAADIAAWCDCSPQMISRIEHRALAKVRRKLAETEATALAAQEVAEVLTLPRPMPSLSIGRGCLASRKPNVRFL